jgi:hypothetical protein
VQVGRYWVSALSEAASRAGMNPRVGDLSKLALVDVYGALSIRPSHCGFANSRLCAERRAEVRRGFVTSGGVLASPGIEFVCAECPLALSLGLDSSSTSSVVCERFLSQRRIHH